MIERLYFKTVEVDRAQIARVSIIEQNAARKIFEKYIDRTVFSQGGCFLTAEDIEKDIMLTYRHRAEAIPEDNARFKFTSKRDVKYIAEKLQLYLGNLDSKRAKLIVTSRITPREDKQKILDKKLSWIDHQRFEVNVRAYEEALARAKMTSGDVMLEELPYQQLRELLAPKN